jgi:hypothetical protein
MKKKKKKNLNVRQNEKHHKEKRTYVWTQSNNIKYLPACNTYLEELRLPKFITFLNRN